MTRYQVRQVALFTLAAAAFVAAIALAARSEPVALPEDRAVRARLPRLGRLLRAHAPRRAAGDSETAGQAVPIRMGERGTLVRRDTGEVKRRATGMR